MPVQLYNDPRENSVRIYITRDFKFDIIEVPSRWKLDGGEGPKEGKS